MRRLVAIPLLASALAIAAEPARQQWQPFDATLQPKAMEEVCTRMAQGETRRYNWKSDAPVDFNIHHHKGKDVFYPVKREAMRGDGGSFTAKAADEYCWMWTAKNARARVEGRLENPP
jgi:hypothetical protein